MKFLFFLLPFTSGKGASARKSLRHVRRLAPQTLKKCNNNHSLDLNVVANNGSPENEYPLCMCQGDCDNDDDCDGDLVCYTRDSTATITGCAEESSISEQGAGTMHQDFCTVRLIDNYANVADTDDPCKSHLTHDNGPWHGHNLAVNNEVGKESLLDDFTVPQKGEWTIEKLSWFHIWRDNPGAPVGTGLNLSILEDDGGSPGNIKLPDIPNIYEEVNTGEYTLGGTSGFKVFHSTAIFVNPIVLPPGRYWFEAMVTTSPPNIPNWWLQIPKETSVDASPIGQPAWYNYSNAGDLRPTKWNLNFVFEGPWKCDYAYDQ